MTAVYEPHYENDDKEDFNDTDVILMILMKMKKTLVMMMVIWADSWDYCTYSLP